MQQSFEQAQLEFEKGNLDKARILYGMCASFENLSLEMRNTAIFMITVLFLKKYDLKQAQIYYQLFNPNIKTPSLPKDLRSTNLAKLMRKAPFETISNSNLPICDLGGCGIKGDFFLEVLETLQKKKHFKTVRFDYNPLSYSEVHKLLEYYLACDYLTELDLGNLPIDYLALRKIEEILKKISKKSSVTKDTDVFIVKLSDCNVDEDLKLLSHTLKKITSKKIQVEVTDTKANTTHYICSGALLRKSNTKNKINNTKKKTDIEILSSKFLSMLIEDGIVTKTLRPNAVMTTTHPEIPFEPRTQIMSYNTLGELAGHLMDIDGHLTLYIKEAQRLNLARFASLFPCKSLKIHAPGSQITLDTKLEISETAEIFCGDLNYQQSGYIKANKLIINANRKVILNGQVDATFLEIYSKLVTIEKSFRVFSGLSENSKSTSVIINGNNIRVLGGKISTNELYLESKTALHLPESFDLDATQSKIIGQNVFIKCNLTGLTASLEASELVKIDKHATIKTHHCSIISNQILIKSKCITTLMDLHGSELIKLDNCSSIDTTTLSISGKESVCLGKINSARLIHNGELLKISGGIQIQTIKKIDNDDKFSLSSTALALEIDGTIEVDGNFNLDSDKIFLTSRAKLISSSNTTNPKLINKIICRDKLYLDKGAEISCSRPIHIDTKHFVHYGILKSLGNIIIVINGSGEIHDEGIIRSEGVIDLQGSRCWNSGEVDSKGFLNISFDIFFINGICDFNIVSKLKQGKLLGKLRAQNININTAFFFGLLSHITADNNIQLNAFVNLYLGLINAQNIYRSTIAELDLGLNITAFEKIKGIIGFMRKVVSTLSSEKSMQTFLKEQINSIDGKALAISCVSYILQLASIAAQLTIFFAPHIGFTAKIVLAAVNILFQLALNGFSVKSEIIKLIEMSRTGKSIHARDIYPLILNIKNIALAGANAVTLGIGLPSTLHHIPQNVTGTRENILNTLPTIAGLFGGTVSDQSVLQVDLLSNTLTGMSTTMDGIHLSVLSQNLAAVNIETSLFTGAQLNNIVASVRTISTQRYEQHGGKELVDSETIKAKKVIIDGDLKTRSLIISADTLQQNRNLTTKQGTIIAKDIKTNDHLKMKSGTVIADHLEIGDRADSRFENTNFNVKRLHENGKLTTEGCSGHIGNILQSKTGEFIDQGKEVVLADDQKSMTGFSIDGAELHGKTSVSSTVLESTGAIHSTGIFNANDSRITSGKAIHLDGENKIVHSDIQAEELRLADGTSDVSANSSLQGNQLVVGTQARAHLSDTYINFKNIVEDGKVSAEGCSGHLGSIAQSKTGEFIVDGKEVELTDGNRALTGFTIENATLDGKTSIHSTVIDSTGTIHSTGTFNASDSRVTSDEAIHLDGENKIVHSDITADEIHLADGTSDVSANSSLQGNQLVVGAQARAHLSDTYINFKSIVEDGKVIADGCSGHLGSIAQSKTGEFIVDGKEVDLMDGNKALTGFTVDEATLNGKTSINSTVIDSTGTIHSTGTFNANDSKITSGKEILLDGENKIVHSDITADEIHLADGTSDVSANSSLQGNQLIVGTQARAHLSDTYINFKSVVEDGKVTADGCSGHLGSIAQSRTGEFIVDGKEVELTVGNRALTGFTIDSATLDGKTSIHSTVISSTGKIHSTGTFNASDSVINCGAGRISLEGQSQIINSAIIAEELAFKGAADVRDSALKGDSLAVDENTNANIQGSIVDFKSTHAPGTLSLHNCDGKLGTTIQPESGRIIIDGEVERVDGTTSYQQALELDGADLAGSFEVNNAYIHSTKTVDVTGTAFITGSYIKSDDNFNLNLLGYLNCIDTLIDAKNISLVQNTNFVANNSQFNAKQTITMAGTTLVENSLLLRAGNKVNLTATSKFNRGSNSTLILQTDEIATDGQMDVTKLLFDVSLSSKQVNQLLGNPRIKTDDLQIQTNQSVDITTRVTSAENVYIVGKNVTSNATQSLNSLWLESTEGNLEVNQRISCTGQTILISDQGKVVINSSLKSNELYTNGKKGIDVYTRLPKNQKSPYTNAPHTESAPPPEKTELTVPNITFESDGDVNCYGTDLFYDNLNLNIKGNVNLYGPHYKYTNAWGITLDKAYTTNLLGPKPIIVANDFTNYGQVMHAQTAIFKLEGNIANKNGGNISATSFLGIDAKNVINECGTKTVYSHGKHTEYVPSVLKGGDGTYTKGVGLLINAAGSVIVDSSFILSAGSNVINAVDSIECLARSNTFCSSRTDKYGFLGMNEEHTAVYDTIIGRSAIISEQGQNIIVSENGRISATATDFNAQNGTYIYAKEDIELYDLVGTSQVNKSKKSLGIFHSDEKHYDEFSSPTVIADQTGITLISGGDIKSRGTLISTPGHLHVEAINFDMSASKLKHTYQGNSFGMSATLCNQEFFRTNNPCNFSRPLYAADSTLCQFNQLTNSHGALEIGLNAWSTGINLANTGNALINGLRTNTLLQEGLKRYFPSVYAPQLGFNVTWASSSSSSQSLGEGGIFVGSADFEVEDTVKLKGVPVQSMNDFIVKCRNFTLGGEQLHSESNQKTTNLNLTVSAKGDPYQLGMSHSDCKSASDIQVGASLQVGGKLVVNVDTMTVDGSTIDTQQIAGNVKTLNIISRQDEAQSSCQAISVSSGGDFCVSDQKAESRLVKNPAGIHVHNSINGDNKEFVVGVLNSTGGKITSDGVNNFTADKVNAKDVVDYQKTIGISASGNIKDFKQDTQINHLLPPDKQSAAITTTNLNFSKSDYEAKNHTTIHGAGGTHLDVKEVAGKVVTDKSDGKEVTKDRSHSYNVVIPHMTEETKIQFRKNGKWAADILVRAEKKVTDFFAPRKAEAAYFKDNNPSKRKTNTSSIHGKHYEQDKQNRKNEALYDDDQSESKHHSGTKKKVEDKDWGNLDLREDHKDESKVISKDEIREAYINGKMSAATGYIPENIDSYPQVIQAGFYEGYYEAKAKTVGGAFALIGIAALDIAVGGIIAEIGNAAIEFASNLTALGTRTYTLVKNAENICESALDSVKETLQNLEKEIDSNLLSNEEVRKWYHQQLKEIPNRIDKSLPIREQALQAFLMRNEIKMEARDLMVDQEALQTLPPPKTLPEQVQGLYDKNVVGEDLWKSILDGSQRTNKQIDDLLGVINTFTPKR